MDTNSTYRNGISNNPDTRPREERQRRDSTPVVTDVPAIFDSPLAEETFARAAHTKTKEFDSKTRCEDIYLAGVIEAETAALRELQREPNASMAKEYSRKLRAFALWFIGFGIAIFAAGSWVRWIVLHTNDLLLAVLLGAMVPATTVGIHYWISRSKDRERKRVISWVAIGLGLSGVGLLAAVAQRFGVEAPITSDVASLLQGDDNRWVMVSADLTAMFASVILMAWSEDIGKSRHERIRDLRVQIALKRAALQTLRIRRELKADTATNRGIRILLKAYRNIV